MLRTLGYPHVCMGRFDYAEGDRDYTLEHVPQVHGPADGRHSDDAHCVALCFGLNVKPPSTDERKQMRRYLRERFPVCTIQDSGGDG